MIYNIKQVYLLKHLLEGDWKCSIRPSLYLLSQHQVSSLRYESSCSLLDEYKSYNRVGVCDPTLAPLSWLCLNGKRKKGTRWERFWDPEQLPSYRGQKHRSRCDHRSPDTMLIKVPYGSVAIVGRGVANMTSIASSSSIHKVVNAIQDGTSEEPSRIFMPPKRCLRGSTRTSLCVDSLKCPPVDLPLRMP